MVAVHRALVSLGAGNELEQALQCADTYIDSVIAAALFRLKNFHFRFVEGAGRTEALKQIREVFDELPALVPQFLEKAGMKELVMRAVKVVNGAKAEADKGEVNTHSICHRPLKRGLNVDYRNRTRLSSGGEGFVVTKPFVLTTYANLPLGAIASGLASTPTTIGVPTTWLVAVSMVRTVEFVPLASVATI